MSSFPPMSTPNPSPAVEIPRSALTLLSHRCASLGPDGRRALREAGYRAGASIVSSVADHPGRLPRDEFWAAVDAALTDAGLGSITVQTVSPALGAVAWRGSPEAGGTRSERPGVQCHFAAGLMGGILSRTAGRTVDVREVRCGSGADEPCWFLFGAVTSIRSAERAPATTPSRPLDGADEATSGGTP